VRRGEWTERDIFTFWKHPLVELEGKTMVIVGLGAIGSRTAAIAEALGMKVIAAQQAHRPAGSGPYPRVPLEEAVASADAISLHCPLTEETEGLFDADLLSKMKPEAFLVNVGRGPLVDTHAVVEALENGTIAGFATDVLDEEPPPAGHPLQDAPNCLVTPHIGWATKEARTRLLEITARNISSFLDGNPQHVVATPE
jgi:glycerate dehydrogenase